MLDLLVPVERLHDIEPGKIISKQLADLRHIRLHHLPKTGDLRLRRDGILSNQACNGLVATKWGEAYVDQLGRVQIPVEVAARKSKPDSASMGVRQTHREVPNGVGRTTPAV
jgi:hypothetical protein